jgi:hypothetical protein
MTHRVVEVTAFEQAAAFLEDWEQLAQQLCEPNVFYLPWALRPALEYLCQSQSIHLLFFFRLDGSEQTLDGVLPLRSRRLCPFLPVFSLHSLQHRYCFATTPLVRAGMEDEVALSFAHWLYPHRHRYPVLSLRKLTPDSALAQALHQHLPQRQMRVYQSPVLQRALLIPGDDPQAYLERALSSKKRNKYRRLYDQLAEQGVLQFRELQPGDADLQGWLQTFIRLELSGWKGQEHTAMGSRPACQQFFEALAHEAHQRGQLIMLGLYLDDRPLAMICDLFAPPARFAFKVAFDEGYAKFSPGVLLELENIRRAHAQKAQGLEWLDSCTSPDNSMLNRLWLERRPFYDLHISNGSYWVDAYRLTALVLKRLRQRLKRRTAAKAPPM